MSQRLVDRSPDLKRLRDEGFDVKIVLGKYLMIGSVPYVNADKVIKLGTLVTELELEQDKTAKPHNHAVRFIGEVPCDVRGAALDNAIAVRSREEFAPGIFTDIVLSCKPMPPAYPDCRYPDYYVKMTTYVKVLAAQAWTIDPTVDPKTFPVIPPDEEDDSPFNYYDTASSRAGLDAMNPKLTAPRIAVVGLGGTGSYVLDLVAKTPVKEIHLFDDDKFGQHNAFRCPGALAIEDLRPGMKKVDHYHRVYSRLRRGIVPHPYRITGENADELRGMDFVFLCLDSGEHKDSIMRTLEAAGISFIDVGMGIHAINNALTGILRVTTSTPQKREHVRGQQRVSFAAARGDNDYSRNIQVADLNALNAVLAVVKWKKLRGFYHDLEREHHTTYTLETGRLAREDQ